MPVVERHENTETITAGMFECGRRFGFSQVRPDEFPYVHDMASRLMNHAVSSCETFLAVQAIQPASSLCFREDGAITGLMGVLMLRATAVDQLMQGVFDGENVDLDLLSHAGERPAIGYGWGVAATTKAGGAAITALAMPYRLGPLGRLTFVTKAVTGAGRHVATTRFGYQPLRHADDDMLISYPTLAQAAE